MTARVLRALAGIWLFLLGLIVVLAGLSIIFTQGIWTFWAIYSPFNVWNWGLIFLLALPAIGLMKLAERLDRRILRAPQEKLMQDSEPRQQEKPAKKSMADVIVDGLNKVTPEEWQEHCQKAHTEEDLPIAHLAPEQSEVKPNLQPLFPPNRHLREGPPLSEEELNERTNVLEQLLELDKEKKHLEDQIERCGLLRKQLVERLSQIPKHN